MGIIIGIWVSCFTCTFAKLLDSPDPQGDFFKCTHGWHKNMKGSYQKFHAPRKCNQHTQVTVRLITCFDCAKCMKNDVNNYDCTDEFFKTENRTEKEVKGWRSCSSYESKRESKKN